MKRKVPSLPGGAAYLEERTGRKWTPHGHETKTRGAELGMSTQTRIIELKRGRA